MSLGAEFSDPQLALMRAFAAAMIPACVERELPGADDESIFKAIVAAAEKQPKIVIVALQQIEAFSTDFVTLSEDACSRVMGELQAAQESALSTFATLVVRCYYLDDRVMDALGIAPHPPFPTGKTIEQGDWSLLDPVKAKPKIYRPG